MLIIVRPRREKTCLRWFAITKAQTSLRIRAVWSAPLLFAYCNWQVSYLYFSPAKIQFSSSLDWFESGFVGNPEDGFCRDVAQL